MRGSCWTQLFTLERVCQSWEPLASGRPTQTWALLSPSTVLIAVSKLYIDHGGTWKATVFLWALKTNTNIRKWKRNCIMRRNPGARGGWWPRQGQPGEELWGGGRPGHWARHHTPHRPHQRSWGIPGMVVLRNGQEDHEKEPLSRPQQWWVSDLVQVLQQDHPHLGCSSEGALNGLPQKKHPFTNLVLLEGGLYLFQFKITEQEERSLA